MGADIRGFASDLARDLFMRPVKGTSGAPNVVVAGASGETAVDTYWTGHTVHSAPFTSALESRRYLKKRSALYPFFEQLMDLYGKHEGEVVLDYGCGPGDDVTGYLLFSKAAKVIGIDVSETALDLLRRRLALHGVNPRRVELMRISDSLGRIPLPDASIDWLHCGGVLHHTTHPHEIVKEFARVMKPGAQGRLMLYNRESVWYHVWIAYAQIVVNEAYPGLDADQAFTKSTDGPDCPVSDAWAPRRVLEMIAEAGLEGTFRGGYLSVDELEWWSRYGQAARSDPRLGEEHRRFASAVTLDAAGHPMLEGKSAGIGGVYTIHKPA